MQRILQDFRRAAKAKKKLLAVLVDPEKFDLAAAEGFLPQLPTTTTHIFVGGSTATSEALETCVEALKAQTSLPLVLFPGDYRQVSEAADALLFLSLLSGRNPEYLIGQQIKAVPLLQEIDLEVIPTGYLLIDGGRESAVERVSGTRPLPQEESQAIVDTALAGQYLGMQLIYLEAGSGAASPINSSIISEVKENLQLPLIVGGGIQSREQLEAAYSAGADMVVIGTAFEEGNFF